MATPHPLHLSLIEGLFSAEEAEELLLKIYGMKINFHQKRNLSSLERFGKTDAQADLRIPILEKAKVEIRQFAADAKKEGRKIKIESKITLE